MCSLVIQQDFDARIIDSNSIDRGQRFVEEPTTNKAIFNRFNLVFCAVILLANPGAVNWLAV
jgi:hypothetical protein